MVAALIHLSALKNVIVWLNVKTQTIDVKLIVQQIVAILIVMMMRNVNLHVNSNYALIQLLIRIPGVMLTANILNANTAVHQWLIPVKANVKRTDV